MPNIAPTDTAKLLAYLYDEGLPTVAAEIKSGRFAIPATTSKSLDSDRLLIFLRRQYQDGKINPADIVKCIERGDFALAEAGESASLRAALKRIRDINLGPDKASGEYRATEAAAIADAALRGREERGGG